MLHDEVFFHLREWMIEPTHILTQGAWANIAISPLFLPNKKSDPQMVSLGMGQCPVVPWSFALVHKTVLVPLQFPGHPGTDMLMA